MTELLRNGGFEDGLQHWEALGPAEEQGASAWPGYRRASLQAAGKLRQLVAVARNALYMMSARVRTRGDEGEAHITLIGNSSGDLVKRTYQTEQWIEDVITFMTGQNDTALLVELECARGGAEFDEVSLHPINVLRNGRFEQGLEYWECHAEKNGSCWHEQCRMHIIPPVRIQQDVAVLSNTTYLLSWRAGYDDEKPSAGTPRVSGDIKRANGASLVKSGTITSAPFTFTTTSDDTQVIVELVCRDPFPFHLYEVVVEPQA